MVINLSTYRIFISEDVINIFKQFQQVKRTMNEAGGILLCQKVGSNLYINKASTPNKYDIRSRFEFIRHKDAAQVIVDFEFINSAGKGIYIGEWHTHPENTPNPSPQDRKMISEQYKKGKLSEPFLLLAIIGLKDIYIQLYDNKDNNFIITPLV